MAGASCTDSRRPQVNARPLRAGPAPGATRPHSASALHRDNATPSESPGAGGSSSSFQAAALSSGLDNGLEDATGCGRRIVSLSFAVRTFSFLCKEKRPFSPESGTVFLLHTVSRSATLKSAAVVETTLPPRSALPGAKACFFRGQ